MTARRFKARLRIDESALLSLSEEGRANLLGVDVRQAHPEAVRVSPVTSSHERGHWYIEASFVFIHHVPPTSTSIITAQPE